MNIKEVHFYTLDPSSSKWIQLKLSRVFLKFQNNGPVLLFIRPQYELKHMHTTKLRGIASTLRMGTAISPRQWQLWTAFSFLLGLISMA